MSQNGSLRCIRKIAIAERCLLRAVSHPSPFRYVVRKKQMSPYMFLIPLFEEKRANMELEKKLGTNQ